MAKGESRKTRTYRMKARAESAAATRERILDATLEVFDERTIEDVTLVAIAERSGVTVQTILRHFRSRMGVFEATVVRLGMEMGADRGIAPVGDVPGIVDGLVDHYEKFGDRIARMLSEEVGSPMLQSLAEMGRIYHLEWCKQAFAPALKGLRGATRERRVAQLVALTDIYVWKLLRRDRGLNMRQTRQAMIEMIEPLMEPGP